MLGMPPPDCKGTEGTGQNGQFEREMAARLALQGRVETTTRGEGQQRH